MYFLIELKDFQILPGPGGHPSGFFCHINLKKRKRKVNKNRNADNKIPIISLLQGINNSKLKDVASKVLVIVIDIL